MKKIIINGNKELKGNIKISGAKNSAVALIPAALLCEEKVTIYNVPEISDTYNLIEIIEFLGGICEFKNETLEIDPSKIENKLIPEELSKKLRASYYFMGSLLGKFLEVKMHFPGGCKIGERPIDLHLKGFKKLGATTINDGDLYEINTKELIGNKIYLDFASVGATINIMLAASKAKGVTTISNAAKEPEIVNVATFLNNMGAKIRGAGTSEIKITGVTHLKKAVIDVIPDRIEAGTYTIIGALLGNDLTINELIPTHIEALLSKLKDIGVKMEISNSSIKLTKSNYLLPINIKTLPYPGFPTDLGQPITVLLTQCNGNSFFEETIYENRVGHIEYLNQMGASIENRKPNAMIKGKTELHGTKVVSTDLRAGAALVIAGLIASGTTTIENVEHVLRGYENLTEKLKAVGADIQLIEE